MNLNEYLEIEQYSLNKIERQKIFFDLLLDLHQHHFINSIEYNAVYKKLFHDINNINDIPFLPINLFKEYNLKSISDNNVYKILTSSGTGGDKVSKIYLDVETSRLQTLALSKIFNHIIGNERLPMLIIDSKSVLKDRSTFSARGAGILGLSIFGKNHTYLLDENYNIDYNTFTDFLAKFSGKKILIFGFTYMIWKYLFLENNIQNIDLSNAIIIHSGGWKKMEELSVDNFTFKQKLYEKFKIKSIYNFYGMAEQVGSVFVENSEGYLHCSNFSDIIIRNPIDFSIMPNGKEGLIQVLSVLPKSYPGHSILTEDIGICFGEDNASNGWKGKYFKILGRVKKSALRGCSDTFAKSI
jgi:phenylacetate-coenzyme A ligase PaaK-like adenylate-forming protein